MKCFRSLAFWLVAAIAVASSEKRLRQNQEPKRADRQ